MNVFFSRLKLNFKILTNFGIIYAFYDLVNSLFMEKGEIGHYLHKKKHNYIKKYITKEYSELIENYKKMKIEDNYIDKKSPIFVFWWQGAENAPEVVKSCIKSLKNHSKEHTVNVIDKNNYMAYVDLPDYIVEKFNQGKISITNFSDILRFNLLYKNGGMWVDATVYATDIIDDDIYEHKFYSIHHNKYTDYHVCRGLWATSFLASGKNSKLMKFIKDFFDEYMKKNDIFICYFLIDCLLAVAYENIEALKKEITDVPINNENYFELEKNLQNQYSEKTFNKFNGTYLFKTTYKKKFEEKTDGKMTFFGAVINNKI